MKYAIAALLSICILTTSAITDEFTPPNLSDGCACPGELLQYTCTMSGDIFAAIWSGTAFMCPSNENQRVILKSTFNNLLAIGSGCGSFIVTNASVDNSTGNPCYYSEVSVNISTGMNRQTVRCSRDSVNNAVGTPHTLSVTGAAPESLDVSTINRFTFTFSWTPTVSCSYISSYRVNAAMIDCGNCSYNLGTNTATCFGWTPNGQTCSVRTASVLSEVCGGMAGEPSASLDLLLQEPHPPNVSVEPSYTQSTGALSSLGISFPTVPPVQVAPGLSPPVTYSVQFNSDTREFSKSNCSGGVCTGTYFEEFPTEDFDFAVVVSNGLGDGRASASTRVLYNTSSVVSLTVQVNESTAVFTLNLFEGFVGATSIRVEYSTGGGVVMNANSSSMATAGNKLTLLLTFLRIGEIYTYTVYFTYNEMITQIQGLFSSRCPLEDLGSSNNLTKRDCTAGNFIGGVRTADGNGDVCHTGTTPGKGFFAETFCDEGYQPQPDSSVRRDCQGDGTWSGSLVQCVKQSSLPPWAIAVVTIILFSVLACVPFFAGIAIHFYHKHNTKALSDPNKLEPVYEEPDDLKPDPHTEGNLAYGHVQHTGRQQSSQPPTELRGQVYEEPENFKPDPHTEGNVAYGQQ